MTVPTPSQDKLPFERLGEYQVLAPIAEGGMASVWLGRSTKPPEGLVALKVIRPEYARNKEFVAMLRDEARIAARLSHPNIISIHDLGHDGKRYFLAMEVLRGRSLAEIRDAAESQGVRIPHEVVAWIGARIADALHYAHEQRDDHGALHDIIHRDVNPANIFLTHEGVPKLIDFGLAKARDRLSSTAIGVVKGKLAYLAPEQAHGHPADRRADVFSLGVTLWEISLGRRLFREDSDVETVRRVREARVPDPTTVAEDYPPEMAAAVMRALAPDPARRWQTAGELRDALDAFVRAAGAGVDADGVRALLAQVSGAQQPRAWESLVEEAAVGPERIRVWDDDLQKLTWMNAAVEVADSPDTTVQAPAAAEPPAATFRERIERALAERTRQIDPTADPVALARAHLELAIVDEVLGDATRAAQHARASLEASPTSAAHAMLRRLEHARGAAASLLVHLDAELAACGSEPARAGLLAERARLVEACSKKLTEPRAAWERVLSVAPQDPAGLRGLEGVLAGMPGAVEALAVHLGRMADAYVAEPRLAAWLHVERAALLDRKLAQPDAAKAALVRALELDPGIGPVRAACTAHAVTHRDAGWLVDLLSREAELENEFARRARLELEAGCIARHRLADADRAVAMLERAASHAPSGSLVHRRAIDDLVTLHESAGRWAEALRGRHARLPLLPDARTRAHELRGIAALQESLGDRRGAIAAVQTALQLAPADATLAEELDRLLELDSLTEQRIALWTRQAAATPDPSKRGEHLIRAARLAESLGDAAGAIEHLRAALVARPASDEAVDGLLRLLAPPPSGPAIAQARARIAVHAHAAEHAVDPARRVAHLEAIALLEEELTGDAARAADAYQGVLRIEPGRRGAVLGLARAAARSADLSTLARTLLQEADATADSTAADGLRLRAAEALASIEADRALALVQQIVARSPGRLDALLLEQRLHENAAKWGQVDAILGVRLEHAPSDAARIDLQLARAELRRTRLKAPKEALASLRAAFAIDPGHPAVREALVAQLDALGDPVALRDGLVELVSSRATPEERARGLAQAGEIDELVLLDDAHAAELSTRATREAPEEAWLHERRARPLRRLGDPRGADLLAALSALLDLEPGPVRAFELATALLDGGADVERATSLIEGILSHDRTAPHALRALERIARATASVPLLANALAQQAEAFQAQAPRLGALWAEEALVEWTLPGGDPTSVVQSILQQTPGDRAALDSTVRLALPRARTGDAGARAALVGALGARLAQSVDDLDRLHDHLALALLLAPEVDARPGGDPSAALAQFRDALRVDPHSVVAAVGAAWLGGALGDADAAVSAALSQADLATAPRQRANLLVQAAGQLLSSPDARLGDRPTRLARAGEILERALEADPEGLPAVGLLVAVRGEDGHRDKLLHALRTAFGRATSGNVIIQLGAEVARIAALPPADHVVAIEALRRVLTVAPGHAPTLRALVGQYVAQGAWAEAVESLETLAGSAREQGVRLGALFQLAEIYGATLHRPVDVERVLRTALDVDPTSLEAARRLLAHRRAGGADAAEIGRLLSRVAELENDSAAKAAVLTELAEVSIAAGDVDAAERSLVEATAQAPTADRIARLQQLHSRAPAEQARVLAAVVARGEALERADAATLTCLGQLEIALGRWPDGVAHLRVAVGLAPAMLEARAALATGLARAPTFAEAVGILLPMIVPDASPILSLRSPAAALATLEGALEGEGRRDDALVARELRVIAGGLDDGAHAELRARRLTFDPSAPIPVALDPATLRAGILPPDMPSLLFALATAIAGAEGKLVHGNLEEVGVEPRDRLTPAGGHPLLMLVHRFATMLEIARPEVALSSVVAQPRVVVKDTPWLVVPEALAEQAEPALAAALARPLTRIALGVAWLDELPGAYAHAVLCSAARQVVPSFATELPEADQELLVDFSRRVGKAIGRRQKKALAELVPALSDARAPTVADVAGFEQAVARAELRVAFVLTGDLLATLDSVRALDADFGRATADVGPGALAATLRHPLAGDLVRFALSTNATALRWRARSLGGRA